MLYPLLAILAVLWIADLVQTLKVTGRYGPRAEYNPVARFLLKHSKYDFIAFKAVDFAVVTAILLFVYQEYVGIAYTLLVTFILVYVYVIFHNHAIVHTMEMKERK
jgi:fatty acid desaturase